MLQLLSYIEKAGAVPSTVSHFQMKALHRLASGNISYLKVMKSQHSGRQLRPLSACREASDDMIRLAVESYALSQL